MPGFSNFRKFGQIQDSVFNGVRNRVLKNNPREVRKTRQMDAEGPPETFNLGSIPGRRAFFSQPTRRIAAGGYGIVMDPALINDALDAAAEALPLAGEVIDDLMGKFILDARRKWPVKTQVSQAMLDADVWVQGDSVHADFISRAPYTYFIKAKKLGGKQPHQ